MRRKLTTLLLVCTMLVLGNLFSVEAMASEETSPIGEEFTVSDITYRIISDTEVEAIDAALKLTTITIPGSVDYNGISYGVTSIPSGAFYGIGRTTKIVISEGVKQIGSTAFQGANAVTEIVLPSTLETFTTIGFKSLSTITLASNNPYFQLKDGVLYSMDGSRLWIYPSAKSETSYVVPEGTVTIGEGAFYQNQNLESLAFGSTVRTLEDYALYQMNALRSITLDGISSIGAHNLKYCGNLKSLTLRNTGSLGNYCVYDCASLETITISGSTSGYGIYAFYELPNLIRYEVSNSSAFRSVDGVLFGGTKLLRYPAAKDCDTYIVPEDTTGIASLAFYDMQHTSEVILNPGVRLDLMAFYYPNENSPMRIYFRDRNRVSLSNSSSGVFVGLKEGSSIYLPGGSAYEHFLSYEKAVQPAETVSVEKKGILATGLTLNTNEVCLKPSKTYSLLATLTPYYSTEEIQWSSNNESVAKVSSDGVVSPCGYGSCVITATTESGLTKSCTVTVEKTDLGTLTMTGVWTVTYCGEACIPEFSIVDGNYELVMGKDYTVSCQNNVNVGEATITITGIGNYEGSKQLTFTILQKNISDLTISSIPAQVYTGTEICPSLVVKDGNQVLVHGVDYTISYENNVMCGMATAVITGIGNYTGTVLKQYQVFTQTGWQSLNGKWYYFDENGEMHKGWLSLEGALYYFEPTTGVMLSNAWLDETYYFHSNGTMATGWTLFGSDYYFFDARGAKVRNQWLGSYYLKSNGIMARNEWVGSYYVEGNGAYVSSSGWLFVQGNWYYLGAGGVRQQGWLYIGGTWYYLNTNGVMQTGWQLIGGTWYYFNSGGGMVTGWQMIGGTWYYFHGSGAMATGWLNLGGTWYYLHSSGAMATGWQAIGGTWYYFHGSGAMAANQWVENYYLQADGSMAVNKRIGVYYVGADGAWIPNR